MSETSVGGKVVDVKFASIATAAVDTTVVAAVTGKKIRVLSCFLVSDTASTTARFESGTGGTAISGLMLLGLSQVLVLPHNEAGWFETAAAALLNLECATGGVDGGLTYVEV